MTKDNFKLLDLDENIRDTRTKEVQHLIDACEVLDLILDCATSDVVCYVENKWGESICIG